MPRHKHADLIIAWANGAEIQYKFEEGGLWLDFRTADPSWYNCVEYRIKPKPDVVCYRYMYAGAGVHTEPPITGDYEKIVFDGETLRVKAVELILQADSA